MYWDDYGLHYSPAYATPPLLSSGTPSPVENTEKPKEKEMTVYEQIFARNEQQKTMLERLREMNSLRKTDEYKEQHKALEEALEEAQKSKSNIKDRSDGTAKVDTGVKGGMRWLSNGITALANIGRSITGLEKGKWKHPEKAAISAAAIAGTYALCSIPVVGWIIGAGLAVTGIVCGTVKAIKGAKKLKEANKSGNQEKIDAAQQDIIGGGVIGVLSAFGLKSAGAAARTSAIANGTKASVATARSGIIGKTVEWTSQTTKDMFVNSWKTGIKMDKTLIARNGFGSTWWSNLKAPFTSYKKKYDSSRSNIEKSLNSRERDIRALQSSSTDPKEIALLEEERLLIQLNKKELVSLRNAKTKSSIDKYLERTSEGMKRVNKYKLDNHCVNKYKLDNHGYLKLGSKRLTIGGNKIKMTQKEFNSFVRNMTKMQQQHQEALTYLVNTRTSAMRSLTRQAEKYESELRAYVGAPGSKSLFKPGTWLQNPYAIAIGGSNPAGVGKLLNLTLAAPESRIPYLTAMHNQKHSDAFGQTQLLSAAEAQQYKDNLNAQIEAITTIKKGIETAQTPEELQYYLTALNQLTNPQPEEIQNPQSDEQIA